MHLNLNTILRIIEKSDKRGVKDWSDAHCSTESLERRDRC